MSRREEKFEECKSGCASNGITDALTNLLMKVLRDAVSENRNHNFSVYQCDYGLELECRTLLANLTESAAWFGVTFP